MKKDLSPIKYMALITQVGLSMITPILMGVFIGQWLDGKFSTGGIFFIVFMLIGVASAFYNLFKLPKMIKNRKEPKDDQ